MTSLTLLEAAAGTGAALGKIGVTFGAGISTVAAAYGIGNIGKTALESLARQPEVAGDIRTNMILSCAFIEGIAFLSIVICLLGLFF
jgi:F-type H+-transporting ATPase subunit c